MTAICWHSNRLSNATWSCLLLQPRTFNWGESTGINLPQADFSHLHLKKKNISSCARYASSIKAKFKAERSGAEWIESLEAVEASVEVVLLLTLWIQGVFSVVKLGSLFWAEKNPKKTRRISSSSTNTSTLELAHWPTWVCQNLFGLGDVDELFLSFLLFLRILEVVWVPLLSQLSVRSDDLLLLGGPGTRSV